MYLFTYAHIYICIHMHIYIFVYICTYMYLYTYAHKYICIHMHIYIFVYICTHHSHASHVFHSHLGAVCRSYIPAFVYKVRRVPHSVSHTLHTSHTFDLISHTRTVFHKSSQYYTQSPFIFPCIPSPSPSPPDPTTAPAPPSWP